MVVFAGFFLNNLLHYFQILHLILLLRNLQNLSINGINNYKKSKNILGLDDNPKNDDPGELGVNPRHERPQHEQANQVFLLLPLYDQTVNCDELQQMVRRLEGQF